MARCSTHISLHARYPPHLRSMNTTLLVYPIERSCSSFKRKRAAPKEHLRHPHVPSVSDLAGWVLDQSLCISPYSRSLAAVCFAPLLTTRSGRTSHSVTQSHDFARKAEPSDPSLACTPGASGGRHCSASARRSRLEGRHDLCFRKGTPPGRAATDPRKTIAPRPTPMQCLSDHSLRIEPSMTPLRSQQSLRVRCTASVSTARNEGQLISSVTLSPAVCCGREYPCKISLACSAIVPS